MAVLWPLTYKLGFREVANLLLQRGYEVTHETIRDWESRLAPLLAEQLRTKRRGHAARRFLRRLVDAADGKPLPVTTDQRPAYRRAIRWIFGREVLHRTTQCLNNFAEQSHRAVKQRYYPLLGFESFESASRFCAAFDELRQYF